MLASGCRRALHAALLAASVRLHTQLGCGRAGGLPQQGDGAQYTLASNPQMASRVCRPYARGPAAAAAAVGTTAAAAVAAASGLGSRDGGGSRARARGTCRRSWRVRNPCEYSVCNIMLPPSYTWVYTGAGCTVAGCVFITRSRPRCAAAVLPARLRHPPVPAAPNQGCSASGQYPTR